jgi:protein ImuB
MTRRYVSIWFKYLVTDWLARREPELKALPFVISRPERGRVVVVQANRVAEESGITIGMALPDARALLPQIANFDEKPGFALQLLDQLADWAIRYTPGVQVTDDDGLMLDITGCAHLRGGEHPCLRDIIVRLRSAGIEARGAMADTMGAAWAVARYGREKPLIESGAQADAIANLPPAALRISETTVQRLTQLGIRRIGDLQKLPRASLNRRFGPELTLRLCQALGEVQEAFAPKRLQDPYHERLKISDGVATAEGIAQALRHLLAKLCDRLTSENKGVRSLQFECHRLDGVRQELTIGTNRPVRDAAHLFKLFENKLDSIEPALGIEVFTISANGVEELPAAQEAMIGQTPALDDAFPELVDRFSNRLGAKALSRYLPQEHHAPERSVKRTTNFSDVPATSWDTGRLRPIRLVSPPEPVEVTAPVPDYPPMFFRHQGKMHRVRKADGPERIEREWWLESGEARDYFRVENEQGARFWLYRSGHYRDGEPARWFLHGYFA